MNLLRVKVVLRGNVHFIKQEEIQGVTLVIDGGDADCNTRREIVMSAETAADRLAAGLALEDAPKQLLPASWNERGPCPHCDGWDQHKPGCSNPEWTP